MIADLENALGIVRSVADKLDRENAELRHDVKRLSDQNGDILDELHALKEKIKVKDQIIVELQQMIAEPRARAGTR